MEHQVPQLYTMALSHSKVGVLVAMVGLMLKTKTTGMLKMSKLMTLKYPL